MDEYRETIRDIAYVMRYGRQPYSEILALPWRRFQHLKLALARMVMDEGGLLSD